MSAAVFFTIRGFFSLVAVEFSEMLTNLLKAVFCGLGVAVRVAWGVEPPVDSSLIFPGFFKLVIVRLNELGDAREDNIGATTC